MATQTLNASNEGTPDYTTITTFENQNRDLVTETVALTLECTGGSSTPKDAATSVVFSGWTTSATYLLTIKGMDNHGTTFNTSTYYMEGSGTKVFEGGYLGCNDIRLENLQFSGTGAATDVIYWNNSQSGTFSFDRVRVRNTAGTPTGRGFYCHVGSGTGGAFHLTNCLAYGHGKGVYFFLRDSLSKLYNCTFANNASYGVDGSIGAGGTCEVKNVVSYNTSATADFNGSYTSASDYNAASDTTTPGSPGSNNNDSISDPFTNAASNDYSLDTSVSGACFDEGVDLSAATPAVTEDIEGTARGGTWDIGAWEATAAAAGGKKLKLIL